MTPLESLPFNSEESAWLRVRSAAFAPHVAPRLALQSPAPCSAPAAGSRPARPARPAPPELRSRPSHECRNVSDPPWRWRSISCTISTSPSSLPCLEGMWFPLSWITGKPLATAPPEPRRRRGLGCERDLRASRAPPIPVPCGAASWEGAGVGDARGGVTAALGAAVGASLRPLRLEKKLPQPEAEAAAGRGAAGPGWAGGWPRALRRRGAGRKLPSREGIPS